MPASPRSRVARAGVLFCAGLTQASGASLQTIYNFRGGADGEYPSAALALRKDGAIFGTTTYGGGKHRGTVFMLTPPSGGQTGWNEAVIADFAKNNHGKTPAGGVIAVGNTLFGTATYRGGPSGCGTAFSVHDGKAKGWTIQTIWQFGGTPAGDGCEPGGPLTAAPDGTLYGATAFGGAGGDGMIFSLTPPAKGQTDWTETDLFDFTTSQQGREPDGGLLLGADGSLYGTSASTGAPGGGVFHLAPPANGQTGWTFTMLFSFGPNNCDGPSPPVADSAGTLYATCFYGGAYGGGMVYSLTPPAPGGTAWTETSLWNFPNDQNGSDPVNSVIIGKGGVLYGTTYTPNGTPGYGTVYKLLPPGRDAGRKNGTSWQLQTLWTFSGTDGANPDSPLIAIGDTLIGSTFGGGATGGGTVFVLTP